MGTVSLVCSSDNWPSMTFSKLSDITLFLSLETTFWIQHSSYKAKVLIQCLSPWALSDFHFFKISFLVFCRKILEGQKLEKNTMCAKMFSFKYIDMDLVKLWLNAGGCLQNCNGIYFFDFKPHPSCEIVKTSLTDLTIVRLAQDSAFIKYIVLCGFFYLDQMICWSFNGCLAESWNPLALSLPMQMLLSLKAQGSKNFWKLSLPCHVGIHWIALIEYSQVSAHVPGFQSFLKFFCIILNRPN